MSRTQRAIAACMVVVTVLAGAPVASADVYQDRMCLTNPAYRSMHEECESQRDPHPGTPSGPGGILGAIGGLLHGLTGGLL